MRPWYKYGITKNLAQRFSAHQRRIMQGGIVAVLKFSTMAAYSAAEKVIESAAKKMGEHRDYPTNTEKIGKHTEMLCTIDINKYITLAMSLSGFVETVSTAHLEKYLTTEGPRPDERGRNMASGNRASVWESVQTQAQHLLVTHVLNAEGVTGDVGFGRFIWLLCRRLPYAAIWNLLSRSPMRDFGTVTNESRFMKAMSEGAITLEDVCREVYR